MKELLLVSISDEKPAPMRRHSITCRIGHVLWFQSQTRSQPPCDGYKEPLYWPLPNVSISDEKPAPMRRLVGENLGLTLCGFNLRREASPHATH